VTRPSVEEVERYVPMWSYASLVNDWPYRVRYEEPFAYQERWDHFIQPPSGWWLANGERVTQRLLAARAAASTL